jgi:hypothetical protein
MATDKKAATPATPNPSAAVSTVKGILDALSGSNGEITLAIAVAGQLVPLITGAVTEIKKIASGAETVSYSVLLETDAEELDAVDTLSKDDLTAINAELARLGAPPA